MTPTDAVETFLTEPPAAPGPRLLLNAEDPAQCSRWVISGYQGPVLPPRLTSPVFERVDSGRPATWRLRSREGEWEFRAIAVDRHEERPELLAPLLAGFALRWHERAAARLLLRLLHLPGGAWLLRRWHERRR